MAVEFRLLGDIQVCVDSRPIEVGHARQRCVLGALLMDANRVVPGDQLVDRVWGERRLPTRPVYTLQTYVARLRRLLAATGEVTIDWRSGGYRLTVDPEALDLHRFHELTSQARACADDDAAATLLERALLLWRGEPLAALDSAWFDLARETLVRQRHAARLELTDIELRRGRHSALLAELANQAAEHPLNERVAGQLMIALYRSGDQAQALRHYRQIRHRLAEDLGVDPGPPLQQLHQQILCADSALAVPAARRPIQRTAGQVEPAGPVVPRQLPAAPRMFAGRVEQLDQLSAALEHSGGVVVMTAISGIGGIGKTWLALHWAHRHADRFPDGQLHVNLRGFDPVEQPVPAEVALRGFLRALGVPPASIPAELDSQASLYRSLLADRRMLVVLDNALDSRQVEPLLPGGPSCAVLVTSRRHLSGLITSHGAHSLELDVLDDHEAVGLLRGHLGAGRIAAEPEATAQLVAWCAGLPLALGIVAVRAATRSRFALADVAGELRDAAARLDALDGGELTANVRAVLSWSHDALCSETARVFALLGLAPGPDISMPAVVSLTALPEGRAHAALRELADAQLIQQHLPGRYRLHDLVRIYATEQAQHGAEAVRRLVDFYLHTAASGERALYPYRDAISMPDPIPGCRPQALSDQAAVLAWFDAEQHCLLAAQHQALERGWNRVVWQLAWALSTFHRRRGYFHDQHVAWRAGLAAAERADDPAPQVLGHRRIGLACARLGRHDAAIDHLNRALALAERSGDLLGQAHSHQALGTCWEFAGDDEAALVHTSRALRLFQTAGTPQQEAEARNGVGWHLAKLGRYPEAQAQCEAALTMHRAHNHGGGEANTLDSLHFVSYHMGRHDQALDYGHRALALFRHLGHVHEEANTLTQLGHVHLALDQPSQARQCWQQAHELFRGQHRGQDANRVSAWLATLDEPARHGPSDAGLVLRIAR